MRKIGLWLAWLGWLFTACNPMQLLVPTVTVTQTPTATSTATPTNTSTATLTPTSSLPPTFTPTVTPTRTRVPTQTLTPFPGLGVLRKPIQDFFKEVEFEFDTIGMVDGEYVVKAFSPTGFTRLSLYAQPDYLTRAQIEITTTGEAARLSTVYWMAFLEFTTPDGEKAAAWVREFYTAAASRGRLETNLGEVKIVLEVGIKTLRIIVLPGR